MPDLILHHYATSPFSEKMRLILGHKQLAWKSVHIPPIMPKPDVQALTGGYRRTPVLQVGADIYCDTGLICDVLEHHQPVPSLYPPQHKGLTRIMAQWADSTLFWAAMAHAMQPSGLADMFGQLPPEAGKAFAADRGAMAAGMARLRPADATAALKSYLRRLSETLETQDYLVDAVPVLADFSAYHPLWYVRTRTPSTAGVFEPFPSVLAWMDRIAAIGHGQPEKMTSAEAIAVAAAGEPLPVAGETFQDDHGIALGSRVTVTAEAFGPEPTEGELVAATRMHFTLRRQDARAGTVHVHFPRIGFVLRAA
ncbi:glutathione S-transferase family protein [Pseudorhodoferax sp. Leaf267]|uniref:glutathione S-transferase family protein n=1 Tax=Pseudorhodoferax sp. Leaf267 TaxID=1736316 RepID=UPI0006F30AEA|nr:glutathione S-transferase family protein [Pseudorhodoferax sp. Leaf267]KQP14894.1 glutathione S-transferase [Pseudorhodoferax sp. Leaf267]